MFIKRDGKIYELTKDEVFSAYKEQMTENFSVDIRAVIDNYLTEDSVAEINEEDLETFIMLMTPVAYDIYLSIDSSPYEAAEAAIEDYLADHDYKFPFGGDIDFCAII